VAACQQKESGKGWFEVASQAP